MQNMENEFVKSRLQSSANNSSHYVWLISPSLSKYLCKNGWLFAYERAVGFVIVAVEPLAPPELPRNAYSHPSLMEDVKEFKAHVGTNKILYAAVGEEFANALGPHGYEFLRIGEEPWINLENYLPRGNAGKGVRSARNQAIKKGLRVEEWTLAEIKNDKDKGNKVEFLYKQWLNNTIMNLGGFLFNFNPYADVPNRKYFICLHEDKPQSFLIATPIVSGESYYFEDLVYAQNAIDGASELITLEAIRILEEKGIKKASLGIVMLNIVGKIDTFSPKCISIYELKTMRFLLKCFYNSEGIGLHRKRFKPNAWTGIYNGLEKLPSTASWASQKLHWAMGTLAAIEACKPRLKVSFESLRGVVKSLFQSRPACILWLLTLSLSFAFFRENFLFSEAERDFFSFKPTAPLWQWPLRSLFSDISVPNAQLFGVYFLGSLLLLGFLEKRIGSKRLGSIMIFAIFSTDILNYLLFTYPHQFIHVGFFNHLIVQKGEGCSFLLLFLLGLALFQFKRWRDILISVLSISILLTIIYSDKHLKGVLEHLNYFFFLMWGFAMGKYLRIRQSFKDKKNLKKSVSSKKADAQTSRLTAKS